MPLDPLTRLAPPRRWLRLLPATLLTVWQTVHAAGNCEAIREQIGAKIRASGVSQFELTVVPAESLTSGKVVGRCELGSKKIVYQRAGSQPASAAGAKRERIITECRDGSVVVDGDCKP